MTTSTTVLETRQLSKSFGGVVAAEQVDFKVNEGELRCIIGPNGAGKSTLFSLLCGILRPDSGGIWIHNREVTKWPAFRRARLGVGLTFQTNRAFHALSVRDNLAIPHPPKAEQGTGAGGERFAYALEMFGIDPGSTAAAGTLPHHRLQWLEILMVLASHPDLLLLDEPTAGMSTEETTRTAEVLRHLNATGLSIVVVEHDIVFVRAVAQTVTVLHQGRIFSEGSVTEITANEDVQKIYLGKA